MMKDRPQRYRLRLSTLMLLVLIAALAIALVIERRNHERELQLLRAKVEAEKAGQVMLHKALQASYQALERAKQAHPAAEATVAKAERSKPPPGESPGRTNDESR